MPTTTKAPSRVLIFLAFASLYLIWGSTYLFILYAIETIPPFFTVGSRYVIAGLLLLGWSLLRGEKLPPIDMIGKIAIGGVLLLFVGNGAVTWSEQYLPSGLAAVIVATVPLWFVLLDKRQWSYHFSNKWIIIGLLTGFAGVVLLFSGKGSNRSSANYSWLPYLVVVAGTIGWAIGSLYSKYKPVEASTTMKAAIQMLAGGILAYIVGFSSGEHRHFYLQQVSASSLGALLFLIIAGSVVAYMAYIWLLSIKPASVVGTYAYVNPVVAVFLGWAFVGETISQLQVLALCVVLAGVLLVNFAKDVKPLQKRA
ncbi:MAG: EamA family transporter [Flaviaesturariibacter sp.]|nr:EamA family transporter [Flaviaesturariibacter sp.]